MGPEDNPFDDVQPTEEEWDEYERQMNEAKAAEIADDAKRSEDNVTVDEAGRRDASL